MIIIRTSTDRIDIRPETEEERLYLTKQLGINRDGLLFFTCDLVGYGFED